MHIKLVGFLFAFLSCTSSYAVDEKQIKDLSRETAVLAAETVSYGAYSAQIVAARVMGRKDREKRLEFCWWETQNFLEAIKKARTKQEQEAICRQFQDQLVVCQRLVSSL